MAQTAYDQQRKAAEQAARRAISRDYHSGRNTAVLPMSPARELQKHLEDSLLQPPKTHTNWQRIRLLSVMIVGFVTLTGLTGLLLYISL